MRSFEIFFTIFMIFMISHFILVVLLAVFNIRYRYRVPFFLDKYGFHDLAENMSYIIEKRKNYSKPFLSHKDSKFEDKVWKEFYKLKLDKNKGDLYRIHKFYKFLSFFIIYVCSLWGVFVMIMIILVLIYC